LTQATAAENVKSSPLRASTRKLFLPAQTTSHATDVAQKQSRDNFHSCHFNLRPTFFLLPSSFFGKFNMLHNNFIKQADGATVAKAARRPMKCTMLTGYETTQLDEKSINCARRQRERKAADKSLQIQLRSLH